MYSDTYKMGSLGLTRIKSKLCFWETCTFHDLNLFFKPVERTANLISNSEVYLQI